MAEIIKPLLVLKANQAFTADADGAHVITADHTHADILRYVVADIGKAEARFIIDEIEAKGAA